MEPITCYLLEPTGTVRRALRRFAWSNGDVEHYHDASVPLDVVPDGPDCISGDVWPHEDPRWPTVCECGYEFTPVDPYQLNHDPLYRRSDTGESTTLHEAPFGAMWWAPWMAEAGAGGYGSRFYKARGGGPMLFVKTPGGDWCVDSAASNGDGWEWTGSPPCVTASPSILANQYHGWLRDGVLVPC